MKKPLRTLLTLLVLAAVTATGCSGDGDGGSPEPDAQASSEAPEGETFPVRYNVWDDTKQKPLAGETELVVEGEEPWFPKLGQVDAKVIGGWVPGTSRSFSFYPDGRDGEEISFEMVYETTAPRPAPGETIEVVILIKDDFVKVESAWAFFNENFPRA